jgi:hypothetical protein
MELIDSKVSSNIRKRQLSAVTQKYPVSVFLNLFLGQSLMQNKMTAKIETQWRCSMSTIISFSIPDKNLSGEVPG